MPTQFIQCAGMAGASTIRLDDRHMAQLRKAERILSPQAMRIGWAVLESANARTPSLASSIAMSVWEKDEDLDDSIALELRFFGKPHQLTLIIDDTECHAWVCLDDEISTELPIADISAVLTFVNAKLATVFPTA